MASKTTCIGCGHRRPIAGKAFCRGCLTSLHQNVPLWKRMRRDNGDIAPHWQAYGKYADGRIFASPVRASNRAMAEQRVMQSVHQGCGAEIASLQFIPMTKTAA